MPDVALPFSREEYAQRLAKTRAAMEAAGIELLIAVDPSNMAWLTGYDGWSFYVHQAVLLGLEGEPIWWGRMQDANGARRTVFMAEENIVGYPDHYVQSTERHPMDHLAALIRDHGWGGKRVGLELENYYFSAAAYLALQKGLPDARFVDATALVNRQRGVKSPQEIAYMRRAARIVEKMHDRILSVVKPGKRKNEIAAEIFHAGILGAEENGAAFGGDYPAIVPMLPTGPFSAAPHITWSDRRFQPGATIVEIAGCRRRYHCPLARTVYLGTPSERERDTEKAVIEGVAEALGAVKAGALAEDVEAAWRKSVSRWGIVKESRLGYSIGINYPPDWGEHSTSLRPGDKTELQPNMTFHLMPGLWFDDWGIEISQPFRVTETGHEALTSYPRELIVKA